MFKQSETSNMKHTKLFSVLLLVIGFGLPAFSQNTLKKANKEFELFAYNLAAKSYLKVLQKDQNNVEALSRLGDCYRHLNQMEEAAAWYTKALDQEGVDPVNLFYMGEVMKAKGEYLKAKEFFEIYGEGQPFFGDHYAASCDFALSMQGVPAYYRVKKEFMNTTNSDFGANFYKDKVVFSSARTDIPRVDRVKGQNWTGDLKNQLYISSIDDNGYLTQPDFLHNDLTNDFNEGPLSYSADGKMVAYTKNDFVDGTRQIASSGMESSIYLAEVGPGGDFFNAKPFPFNGSGYSSGFPAFSQNGKLLYFSSNRPDGLGGWDIYVSRKTGDTWSTPENLGAVVNSSGNELTPFVIGNSLYFSSDWHHGFGGLDVFRAESTNGEWTKVYHLGNGINSPMDDYGLVFNANKNVGYFTSNRIGGKGREDIYQFSKRTDQVLINVSDANGNPLPEATVDFSACNESIFQTDEGGNYAFQALGGLECEAIISKEGYTSYLLKVESSSVRKDQNYQVVLVKEAKRLSGRVINMESSLALNKVYVRAVDQSEGEVMDDFTDENGTYSLPLKNGKVYVIRYSKAGYTDMHNRVNVGDGSDKDVLGVFPLPPSTTKLEGTGSVSTNAEDNSSGSTESVELKTEGYAIQLAAVYGNEKINTASFKSLGDIGNLYTRPDKGYTKLRLGIFETREEADAAKTRVLAKGYNGVFLVSEKLENMDAVEVYDFPVTAEKTPPVVETTPVKTSPPPVVETTPVETPPVVTTTTTKPKTKPRTTSTSSSNVYKIRLITYQNKNVKYFNPSKIESFGEIEQIRQGGLTIMLLSPFYSLEEVDEVFEKVKVRGFKGAHIITEKNGKWIRVK